MTGWGRLRGVVPDGRRILPGPVGTGDRPGDLRPGQRVGRSAVLVLVALAMAGLALIAGERIAAPRPPVAAQTAAPCAGPTGLEGASLGVVLTVRSIDDAACALQISSAQLLLVLTGVDPSAAGRRFPVTAVDEAVHAALHREIAREVAAGVLTPGQALVLDVTSDVAPLDALLRAVRN